LQVTVISVLNPTLRRITLRFSGGASAASAATGCWAERYIDSLPQPLLPAPRTKPTRALVSGDRQELDDELPNDMLRLALGIVGVDGYDDPLNGRVAWGACLDSFDDRHA